MTVAAGSVVIGLALANQRINAEEGWSLAHLDEIYQTKRWGENTESTARRSSIHDAIVSAVEFMSLSKTG